MFWGLTLDPAKRYAKVVDNAFHISAAVLDTTSASDDEIIRVFVEVEGYETLLCNLSKKLGILQFPLDLQFMEGSRIAFYTQGGKGVVHLSGYVVPDVDAEDLDEEDLDMEEEESDEEAPELVPINKKRKKEEIGAENVKKAKLALGTDEFMDGEDEDDSDEDGEEEEESDDGEEEEDLSDEEGLEEEEGEDDDDDDDDEEEDDEDDEDDDDDDELDDEELLKKMQEALLSKKDKTPKGKDKQLKAGKTPDKQNGNAAKTPQKPEKTPKKEAGKADKTPKKEGGKADKTPKKGEVTMNGTAKGETPKKAPNTPGTIEGKGKGATPVAKPKQEVKAGGVKVIDTMIGKGKMAKKGNMVGVYYVGKLANGKVFDKCMGGKAFHFRLGANEVIKGWDTGVEGMQIGGKRKLVCPPKMAYGASGAPPDIPPHSTLTFEVELREVK